MEDTLIGRITKIILLNKELSRINRDLNKLIKLRKAKIENKQIDENEQSAKIAISYHDSTEIKEIANVLLLIDKKFHNFVKANWKEIATSQILSKLVTDISTKIQNEQLFYRAPIVYIADDSEIHK